MQLSLTRASDVIEAPFQRGPPAGEQMPELGLLGWLLTEGGDSFALFYIPRDSLRRPGLYSRKGSWVWKAGPTGDSQLKQGGQGHWRPNFMDPW